MYKTVTNIALLFWFSLCARLNIVTAAAAAGLRSTDRSTAQQENSALRDATAFQDTETLKLLTDNDEMTFSKYEEVLLNHGYLDRKRWEDIMFASQYNDDDDNYWHVNDDKV